MQTHHIEAAISVMGQSISALDLCFLGIVIAFGVWGYMKGIFSQAWGILALFMGLTGAQPVMEWLLARGIGQSITQSLFGAIILKIGVGFAIYFAVSVMGQLVQHFFIEQIRLISASNRFLGGALGGVKGVVFGGLCIFLGSFLVIENMPNQDQRMWLEVADSQVVHKLGSFSPFNLVFLNRLKPYLHDGAGQGGKTLPSDLSDTALAQLVNDPAFFKAVDHLDFSTIVTNENYRMVFSDLQLVSRISQLN